jgi:hypothetical protein
MNWPSWKVAAFASIVILGIKKASENCFSGAF